MKQCDEMKSLSLHRKIIVLFIGGSVLFNLIYFSAPLCSSIGHQRSASLIYRFFSPLCHQLDSRSFSLFGHPLAVCARCTGIYLGFLAGLIILLLALKEPLKRVPRRGYLFLFLAPAVLDFLLGISGIYASPGVLRSFTGFMLGLILPFYIMPGICEIGSQRASENYLLDGVKSRP
jgi:uncharacterized membrane protein